MDMAEAEVEVETVRFPLKRLAVAPEFMVITPLEMLTFPAKILSSAFVAAKIRSPAPVIENVSVASLPSLFDAPLIVVWPPKDAAPLNMLDAAIEEAPDPDTVTLPLKVLLLPAVDKTPVTASVELKIFAFPFNVTSPPAETAPVNLLSPPDIAVAPVLLNADELLKRLPV